MILTKWSKCSTSSYNHRCKILAKKPAPAHTKKSHLKPHNRTHDSQYKSVRVFKDIRHFVPIQLKMCYTIQYIFASAYMYSSIHGIHPYVLNQLSFYHRSAARAYNTRHSNNIFVSCHPCRRNQSRIHQSSVLDTLIHRMFSIRMFSFSFGRAAATDG